MSRIPMLDNILAQPASHRGLLTLHQGNATLRACAEKIRTAQGRIIFTGMGGSLFATLPAVSRLAQQGYSVQAIESAELLHYGSATLGAGDLGVVVSRSGGSIEPCRRPMRCSSCSRRCSPGTAANLRLPVTAATRRRSLTDPDRRAAKRMSATRSCRDDAA